MILSNRYDNDIYKRCGKSGLLLPKISLGLWHNFGSEDLYSNSEKMILHAFNNGITHFDLANNYGPPPGSAEVTFGKIFKSQLDQYRDEIIVSSKAGYKMWEGPYGEWGSRKYIISSCDQSLKRTGLEYFDIFYHHRPDPNTPIEESMLALDQLVRQGKALYVGISNYDVDQTLYAASILRDLKTPFVIHQGKYNMLERSPEKGLIKACDQLGIGYIAFSPLAQGLLTDKYLDSVPDDSRAAKGVFLKEEMITVKMQAKLKRLNDFALSHRIKLVQLALAWVLRDSRVTSVLIGASKISQIDDALKSLKVTKFDLFEWDKLDDILDDWR
jgi:L-glyceraldehyde 3-phosphate reductase